mmetsp:Transcript_149310/g.212264  ORF Transcript_149310/g.212264 Transcript_149310/m.212264 type:complete len:239 (+) Transcript_149310:43-759(+)
MSDYYKGQRRFALGGKGWTAVLGCIVSLSYIRAKAKLGHEDFSQAHHRLEDRRGNEVRFSDQSEAPEQKEDIVLRLWRRLPETPLPNLYWVGGIFTVIWGYRMWGAFTRLMIIRYADVNYQLRRPDVLANKVVALRFLVLPLLVVPGTALGIGGLAILLNDVEGEDSENPVARLLKEQARGLRDSLQEPCSEAKRLVHDVVDPVATEMDSGPLATFARRAQTVGLLNMPKPEDIIFKR